MSKSISLPSFQISIFYDGLCHLCSREIDHYKKQQGSESIKFVDITSAEFDPTLEGLDPQKVHKYLHVKTAAGKILTGIDAFLEIWKFLPKYKWANQLISIQPMRFTAEIAYALFAEVRPWLPKRKQNCEASPYCETHSKPRGS